MTAATSSGPMLYNPALLSREDLIATFVVRHPELAELLDRVRSAPADHAPQHVLILGWRGMGKTTLLHRLAYAAEDDRKLKQAWLPVLFDEEQLNVGELADFWLNALEMLALAANDRSIGERANDLAAKLRGQELQEAAYELLAASAGRLGKRLLLLVDNMDLVLARIEPDREASRLREILQHEPWLMLVGTSSQAIEATYDYGQPFYDMFRVIELGPLDENQTLDMLVALASRFEAPDVAQVIREDPNKIRKLRLLMGGNPRTVGLLFGVLQEGPTSDFRAQLERLLDSSTSLYKDRLESLPLQTQRVCVALAQRWDPATATEIADDLRVGRGVASGQLHRLVERGLVEKVRLHGRTIGFQVRERFFNLWWLMRGARRSRQSLKWLVEAIDLFFDSQRLSLETQRIIAQLNVPGEVMARSRQIEYGAALMKVIHGGQSRAELIMALMRELSALPLQERAEIFEARELAAAQKHLIADDAINLARQAISAGIYDVVVFQNAVQLLESEGRWGEVASLAELFIKGNRREPLVWQRLAIAHLFLFRPDRAGSVVEELVHLGDKDPFTWEVAANVAFYASGIDEAISSIRSGLAIDPDHSGLNLSGMWLQMADARVMESINGLKASTRAIERPLLPLNLYGVTWFGVLSSLLVDVSGTLRAILQSLEVTTRNWPQLYVLLVPVIMIGAGQRALVLEVFEQGGLEVIAGLLGPILRQTESAQEEQVLAPETTAVTAPWLEIIRALSSEFEKKRITARRIKAATEPTARP